MRSRWMRERERENTATWTAFYINSDRWQQAKLTVVTPRKVKGVLDGAVLTLAKGEGDTLTADLELPIANTLVEGQQLLHPLPLAGFAYPSGDTYMVLERRKDKESAGKTQVSGQACALCADGLFYDLY